MIAPAHVSGAISRLSGSASSASKIGRPRITPAITPATSARRGVYSRDRRPHDAAIVIAPLINVSTWSAISLDPKSFTSSAMVQSISGGLLFQVCR